jgi:hypothetical protein
MNKNSFGSCAPGFRSRVCVCVVVVVISGPLLLVNTNGGPYQICAWRRRRRRRKLKSLLKAKQFYLAKFRKLGNLLGWETPKFVRELQWNWLQEFQQQKIMLWVSVGKTIGRLVEIPELPPYTTYSSHSPRFCLREMKKDIQWNITCMGCALQNCQTKALFCKFADYHQFPFTGPNFKTIFTNKS